MKRLLILFLTLFTTTASAQELFHEIKIGNWIVQGYVQDKKFSHCVASTNYTAANENARRYLRSNDVTIFIKWFENGNIGFGIGGSEWKLKPQNKYNVGFKFNDGNEFNIDSKAENEQVIAVEVKADGSGEWYTKLAKSEWVEIFIEGNTLGKFNLNNSEKTLRVLYNCYIGAKEGQAQVNEEVNGTFGAGRE